MCRYNKTYAILVKSKDFGVEEIGVQITNVPLTRHVT